MARSNKRTRFRYGLISLLVAITALALVLAPVGNAVQRERREREATRRVQSLAGTVRAEPNQTPRWINRWLDILLGPQYVTDTRDVYLPGMPKGESLAFLADFPELRNLTLQAVEIGDVEVSTITRLAQLQRITLRDVQLPHRGVVAITALPKLQEVTLGNCTICATDSGDSSRELFMSAGDGLAIHDIILNQSVCPQLTIAYLAHLPQLEKLSLLSCKIVDMRAADSKSDAAIASTFDHYSPRHIELINTRCPPPALTVLTSVPKLQHLTLRGCGITDEDIERSAIWTSQSIDALEISDASLSDAGVKHLTRLPHLQQLSIFGCPITDQGLDHLNAVATLTYLNAGATAVTERGLLNLRQTLPALAVTCGDYALPSAADMPRVTKLSFTGDFVTDATMSILANATSLKSFSLWDTKVTAEGLRQLPSLSKVKTLTLIGSTISDDGLQHLRDLDNLQSLQLSGTLISDAGLEFLPTARRLKYLSLHNTGVRGEFLNKLTCNDTLDRLILSDSPIDATQLAALRAFPLLRSLELLRIEAAERCTIADAILASLAELPAFRGLTLGNLQITDVGAAALAQSRSLEYLTLNGTGIGDFGLLSLSQISTLKHLSIESSLVTDEGVAAFSSQSPQIKLDIIW